VVVRGAREHNLKDISVELPRDSLIVFTGLSGSGKSSLAFDTIFAEGQRRYVESLSAYARQFLGSDGQARRRLHRGPVTGRLDRPEVDQPQPSLDGRHDHRGLRLPPAAVRPGRSPALPDCGEPITRQSPQQIVDRLLELPERTRFQILAPVVKGRKGEFVDLFAELQTKGFARARVDGEVISLTEPPKLEKQIKHTIEVVVDRLVAKGDDAGAKRASPTRSRPPSALAGGILLVDFVDRPRRRPIASGASPSGWPAPTTTR
jgi:excinuclease ABC subunit A